ncbi:MAG: entericidin A/B family lipoprotein [Verrucomicrobiaceae bacterium]|nr:MAG: entericidin A/B family lipoprotein [Verrucomicrobiaceae bacterium]
MNPVIISKIVSNQLSSFNRTLLCGLAVMVTAALALSTTSCATSKGFGRDVKKVGNKIENAADRTGGAN